MRVIIAGKRDFTNRSFVFDVLNEVFAQIGLPDLIIEGGAKGVDSIAHEYANAHNIPVSTIPADWRTYGRAAGSIRNQQMAELAGKDPDGEAYLIAFWDGKSPGTGNMIKTAARLGIKWHIVNI